MRPSFIVIAALLAACGGTDSGEQPEPSAMNFSMDKTVTYIVATNPGGGYDTYARLIARYMEKHLDGVKIRIRNVPGAGNIVGANQLFVAKPDGLTIGTFNTGLIYAQLLRRCCSVRPDWGRPPTRNCCFWSAYSTLTSAWLVASAGTAGR